jgi:large repetitive protein
MFLSSAAPTLNFGSETVGSVTAGQTDSLSNIGNQLLAIDQFPAPPVPADFVLSPNSPECSAGDRAPMGARQSITMTGNGISGPPVPTTTNVAVDPATAAYATGPVVMGTLVFAVNGNQVAVVPMFGSGVAQTQLLTTPTGSNVATATYAPAINELGSNDATTFMVTPATSQTLLATSATNIRAGQNVIVTATVASSTIGVPTGTVRFMNGNAQLGAAALDTTGQAVLNTQQLATGSNIITAFYSGDHNFQPSNSIFVTVTVSNTSLIMTIRPAQLNIAAVKPGQAVVIVTPMNAFSDTVSLACVGLIRGATCKFSPASLSFSTRSTIPQSVTLVIDPHALTIAGIRMPPKTIPVLRLGLLLLGLGAMLLPFLSSRRAATFGRGRILLVLICVGLGSVLGCADLAPPAAISDEITVQASTPTQGVLASAQIQANMAQ